MFLLYYAMHHSGATRKYQISDIPYMTIGNNVHMTGYPGAALLPCPAAEQRSPDGGVDNRPADMVCTWNVGPMAITYNYLTILLSHFLGECLSQD